jgi:hypothetical protein
MAGMDDGKLRAILDHKIANSLGSGQSDPIAAERTKAEKMYRGEPQGDEKPGRSKVVSRDVAEAVDGAMPALMKIFLGGDKVVEFEPENDGDESQAARETDYVNWIWRQQNPGFMVGYEWAKDALLKKLGTAKVWWEEKTCSKQQTYEGLTDLEYQQLLADPKLELVEHSEYTDPAAGDAPAGAAGVAASGAGYAPAVPALPPPQPSPMPMGAPPASAAVPPPAPSAAPQSMPMPPAVQPLQGEILPPAKLHDAVFRRTADESQVRVMAMPPDETLIERRAGSQDKPWAHRRLWAIGDLCEQYPEKAAEIRAIPGDEGNDYAQERVQRFSDEGYLPRDNADGVLDPSMREVWVTEAYLRVDVDGDGYAELRKVTCAGASAGQVGAILENEEVDDDPFCCLTAIPIPHKLIGQSLADKTIDLQEIKTAITRQVLDNAYTQNNAELFVQGDVDLDALKNRRPGNIIRGKPGSAVTPLPVQPMLAEGLQLISYLDTVRETRTGIRRFEAGPGADALSSAFTQTATGVQSLENSTQERIEEIARIWAETGFTDLFRKIHALVLKHQAEPRRVQLRGTWVDIDPRDWKTRKHMKVAAGLGTGNKQQRLQYLSVIAQKQEQVLLQAGPQNPLVTLRNLYNTYAEMTEAAGFPSADPFFTDPQGAPIQPPQAPQIPPDKLLQIQADSQNAQADRESKERVGMAQLAVNRELGYAKLQVENKAIDVDAMHKQAQLETDRHFRALDHARAVREHETETAFAAHDAQRQAGLDAEAGERADQELGIKAEVARAKAAAPVDKPKPGPQV